MINLNHGSGPLPRPGFEQVVSIGEIINGYIDAALKMKNRAEPKREYLGASRIAEPCARRLAYEYSDEEREEFDGRTLRIFSAGHRFEDLSIEWLQAAGFDLRVRNDRGHQYGFETMGGRVKGHIDGQIVAGPALPGVTYPVLWEHKALNERGWKDLAKNRLKDSKPVYFGQVQIYMGYLNFDACLFTALNKNTQELYHELVKFDPTVAQALSDRAVDIIRGSEHGELPPRIGISPDFYICRFCSKRDRCWSET